MRSRIRTIMYEKDIHRELHRADERTQSLKDIMKEKDYEKKPRDRYKKYRDKNSRCSETSSKSLAVAGVKREDERMSYVIRELYRAKNWPKSKSIPERGMCRKIKVMSHGYDAGLVIDRGVTLPFDDGIIAVFEIHPEDVLKNVILR